MAPIRLGVIGAGMRSAVYLRHCPDRLASRVRLVAIADPVPAHRERFLQVVATGQDPPRQYETGAELLAAEALDGLVIGTPNDQHLADALPAIERRIPLALEKPVATTIPDCNQLWRAYVAADRPPVVVGFVLRYTPFYSRLQALIRDGAVGQVLTIAADENLDTGLTNFFLRSDWRRWDARSGGFMVEKCCHDLDLMSWLAGGRAMRVYSVARRTHLVPSPPGGRLARLDRPAQQDPRIDYGDATLTALINQRYFGSLYDTSDDLPDHQTTVLEYENGVLGTLNAVLAQPHCTRRVKVFGADGYLEGDIRRSRLIHECCDAAGQPRSTETAIDHDASGHHGGDGETVDNFWRCVAAAAEGGEPAAIRAGLADGIEAVVVAAAAEQAKRTGQATEVEPLRQAAFAAGA